MFLEAGQGAKKGEHAVAIPTPRFKTTASARTLEWETERVSTCFGVIEKERGRSRSRSAGRPGGFLIRWKGLSRDKKCRNSMGAKGRALRNPAISWQRKHARNSGDTGA